MTLKLALAALAGAIIGFFLHMLIGPGCPQPTGMQLLPNKWDPAKKAIISRVDTGATVMGLRSEGSYYKVRYTVSPPGSPPPNPYPTDPGNTRILNGSGTPGSYITYNAEIVYTGPASCPHPPQEPLYFQVPVSGVMVDCYMFWDGAGSSLTITVIAEDM